MTEGASPVVLAGTYLLYLAHSLPALLFAKESDLDPIYEYIEEEKCGRR